MISIEAHVPAAFVPAVLQPAIVDRIGVSPIVVDDERQGDAEARESLLDRAFGPARFRKTCERLRAGRLPARGLSLVARVSPLGTGAEAGLDNDGVLVGTVRFWHVDAGGVPALMLGPLAVDARYRSDGIGGRLINVALMRARGLGHRAVLLVGDAPYYARFGFSRDCTRGLAMPGPVEDARFLGLELEDGALATACGRVGATGLLCMSEDRRQHRPQLPQAA